MSYSFPGQSFDHTLTGLKGWPRLNGVDFDANLSTNVNIGGVGTAPLAGQVVHNTALGFEMGANLNQMAIFLWPNGYDFDVANPGVPAGVPLGGQAGTNPAWVPIRPTGKLVGLVAIGAYEFESTEFDTTQTYLINQTLRAVTSNTDANAGKLTNQNASGGQGFGSPGLNVTYTDTVVGVVSRGAYTNSLGKQVVAFWPVYLPGTR